MKKRRSRPIDRPGLRALLWLLALGALITGAILGNQAYNRHLRPPDPIQILGCGVGSSNASDREAAVFRAWKARFPQASSWQAWIVRGFGMASAIDKGFFVVGEAGRLQLYSGHLDPPGNPTLLIELPHAPMQAATHALRLDLLRNGRGNEWVLATESYRGSDTLHVLQYQDPGFKEVWTYGNWGEQHPGQVEGWMLVAIGPAELIIYQSTYGRDDAKPQVALTERIFLPAREGVFKEKHAHPIRLSSIEANLKSVEGCGRYGQLALPTARRPL